MSGTHSSATFVRGAALLAAILVPAFTACSQGSPAPVRTTPPPPAFQTILEGFSSRMLELGAPAVTIQARVNGETWSRAAGLRRLGSDVRAELADPTHVGDITMSMVAVSVLQLVEQGTIHLDDPVGKHIAEFDSLFEPPAPVTVRHLLRHESGMAAYETALFSGKPVPEALTSPLSAVQKLGLTASVPWTASPGQDSGFSSSNYVALGLLLERLHGRPLADVLDSNIIKPLGLQGTHLAGPGLAPATMVHGYITAGGQQVDVTYPAGLAGDAAGGLVSTVEDMNTFYSALMDGGLLGAAMMEEMLASPNGWYAMGLFKWMDSCTGQSYYGHLGDTAGYGTVSIVSPDGKRQVSINLAYPPYIFNTSDGAPSNPHAWEILRIARLALDSTC